MKKVIGALCLVFCIAIAVFGFVLVQGKGTTYEFQQVELIEDYTETDYTSTVSKVVQNTENSAKTEEFEDVEVKLTYKSNVKMDQAQEQLIRRETDKNISKAYTFKVSASGQVQPNHYSWVTFTPKMSKLTGYIIKKEGDEETKTYVEIVFPVADSENAKAVAGQTNFETSAQKPAEKLS